MPSNKEFRVAIDQILKARKDFPISGEISFGTSIPFCIDSRVIKEGLSTNCGAGIDFAAINSGGEIRMCNQSEMFFGNILDVDFLIFGILKKKRSNFRKMIGNKNHVKVAIS